MNEKVSWESQPLPHLNQFSQTAFFSCLKERGERGVWFKEWFTQENVGFEDGIGRGYPIR
jgi:hypothetical protein